MVLGRDKASVKSSEEKGNSVNHNESNGNNTN